MRVLVIEDDRELAEAIGVGLRREQMAVDLAFDGDAGLERALVYGYDVIVLDRDLPRMSGDDVCAHLVEQGCRSRVLMLTAAATIEDRVDGLHLGADDYLPKPFSLEELVARIRSLVRRQATVKHTVLEHAGIQLDLLGHTVQVNGQPVDLTSREYALLEVFMQNHGRILPRTLITDKIWASSYDVDTNLLDVYMSRLRTKLETMSGKPLFKTVRGVGYQLI